MVHTFRCFRDEVDGFGLASEVFSAAVNPDVHDLRAGVRLRQRHVVGGDALVQQRHDDLDVSVGL